MMQDDSASPRLGVPTRGGPPTEPQPGVPARRGGPCEEAVDRRWPGAVMVLLLVLALFWPLGAMGVAAIAYFMIHKGTNDLKASSLAPSRTIDSLRSDANMAKEHAQ